MVGPEHHQPLDKADLDRHLLVDAGAQLPVADVFGLVEADLRGLARLRVSRQAGRIDLGDVGPVQFGDQPAFGIGAQICGSAGLGAETETIEGDERLARLIGSQCH